MIYMNIFRIIEPGMTFQRGKTFQKCKNKKQRVQERKVDVWATF